MAHVTDSTKEHTLGAMLVVASTAVFALSGILTKSISADALTVTCWRGLVGGILMTVYVILRRGNAGQPNSLRLGWRGWLVVVVGAGASVAFIGAFKYTYVANAAFIYATVPFATALLALLVIGERIRGKTVLAGVASLAGVALMVSWGLGAGNLFGDLLALAMTFLSALYVVLIRLHRDTPVVWAGAVSAYLLFGLGWLVTDPLAVSTIDAIYLFTFGCSFALGAILWTEGARLIPAAESGLLGTAEVPFAIFFAWLFLAEVPPAASLFGGLVVLAAVFVHAGSDWRAAKRRLQPATG